MDAQAFTYGTEQALTANTFIREGYKFMGWALSSGGTGVDYVDKQVVSNLNAGTQWMRLLSTPFGPETSSSAATL